MERIKTDDSRGRWWLWLALSALAAAIVICAGVGWLASRQIDLFHAAYFESCSMRAYQYHWQDARQISETFRYDFIMSPDSFVLIEAWVQNGKILKFSQTLPTNCRA